MIRGISLSEFPIIETLDAVSLGPHDVLVFTMPGPAQAHQLKAINDLVAFAWPGRKAIVLDKGVTLKVVEGV